jgi:hypothetical protein
VRKIQRRRKTRGRSAAFIERAIDRVQSTRPRNVSGIYNTIDL